jgi:hypothetical protein
MVEARLLDQSEEEKYEHFLAAQPDALIYYSSRYRRFLEAMLECRSEYWVAVRGDDIVGILPVMALDSAHGGVVNSLPFYGSHGGAFAADHEAATCLQDRWNSLAREPGIAAATMVEHPTRRTDATSVVHTDTDRRFAGFTQLRSSEAGLRTMIDGSARRNIRKAERSDVRVSVDNAAWDLLEEIHLDNMTAMGGNAKPHAFFELLPQHFEAQSQFRIYVASIDKEPVAALLLLYFGTTVEYFTPVTRSDARTSQPMALLLRDSMLDAARDGYRQWNWGGTWAMDDGVGRFKRKWGAQFSEYQYHVQVNDDALRDETPQHLLDWWPGFYVLPFSALRSS